MCAHELAKAIWAVVHEELRNKIQGRTSHMPIPQNTGVPAPEASAARPGAVHCRGPCGRGAMFLVQNEVCHKQTQVWSVRD